MRRTHGFTVKRTDLDFLLGGGVQHIMACPFLIVAIHFKRLQVPVKLIHESSCEVSDLMDFRISQPVDGVQNHLERWRRAVTFLCPREACFCYRVGFDLHFKGFLELVGFL